MGQRSPTVIARPREQGFSALIFDESQDAKNVFRSMSPVVRDLRYEYAFLLTAAPLHDRWSDIAGQLCILPQSRPFIYLRKPHAFEANALQLSLAPIIYLSFLFVPSSESQLYIHSCSSLPGQDSSLYATRIGPSSTIR